MLDQEKDQVVKETETDDQNLDRFFSNEEPEQIEIGEEAEPEETEPEVNDEEPDEVAEEPQPKDKFEGKWALL